MLSLCLTRISSEDGSNEKQDRYGGALGRTDPPDEKRKCRDRHHAAQGNVTGQSHNQNEEHQHNQQCPRRQGHERPGRRGYSFTALEAQPHGEHVSQDGDESRQRRQQKYGAAIDGLGRSIIQTGADRRLEPMCASQPESKRHRCISLQGIEQQSRDRQALRASAGNVRRSDVAAACLANVLSTKHSNQQISKGNRS